MPITTPAGLIPVTSPASGVSTAVTRLPCQISSTCSHTPSVIRVPMPAMNRPVGSTAWASPCVTPAGSGSGCSPQYRRLSRRGPDTAVPGRPRAAVSRPTAAPANTR